MKWKKLCAAALAFSLCLGMAPYATPVSYTHLSVIIVPSRSSPTIFILCLITYPLRGRISDYSLPQSLSAQIIKPFYQSLPKYAIYSIIVFQ